ncbi:hypothetical protein T12_5835 [Trichinella patagoniensis]|uniref:Uncharacterized protein n=1 Tax=Trichinella patagoniensis TaxID=990121 RepID=A0A0V0YSQ8_9BILA|nr:hypothetical protein T12_5835 [Trichinella patagoniensis]
MKKKDQNPTFEYAERKAPLTQPLPTPVCSA